LKVSVSNIAWPAAMDGLAYHLLAQNGIGGIEVAPTRVWPDWSGITPQALAELKSAIAAEGLQVSSLQAILFQKPELQLFAEGSAAKAFADHLRFCAELAAQLGAKSVVFGAPRNRDRGSLSEDEAFDRAVALFGPIAEVYTANGVALGLEANPVQYACNFVTHGATAARLVRAVDNPGLRLHLDIACAAMAGEDIATLVRANADILTHFHASEALLGAVGEEGGEDSAAHSAAAQALREGGYQGWIAVEMRSQEDVAASLQKAAQFAVKTYGEAA
jgi:D-psicose/D-tagatose/L-ribulose 3-epimerase